MPGAFPGIHHDPNTGAPSSFAHPSQTENPIPLAEPTGPLYAIPGMGLHPEVTVGGTMGILRGNWRGRVGLAGARGGMGRGGGQDPPGGPPFQGGADGL